MKSICYLGILLSFIHVSYGQGLDSLPRQIPLRMNQAVTGSAQVRQVARPETTTRSTAPVQVRRTGTRALSQKTIVRQNPFYNTTAKPIAQVRTHRSASSKDGLFYLFLGITIYFALVRLVFLKYMNNLVVSFLQASLKQKQIREQMQQTPLPALLLNLLFVVCGGIYVAFLLQYYQMSEDYGFTMLAVYASAALAVIYICKYLLLKSFGWIFNIEDATDTYIFIVFMVNKLLGITLIPILILMAFSGAPLLGVWVPLSYCIIFIAFAYRYILSFSPIRNQIHVSTFHFFLYLCGFEIIPLLVLYKVLLSFFEKSF